MMTQPLAILPHGKIREGPPTQENVRQVNRI